MAKRQTIGVNPLDALIPPQSPVPVAPEMPARVPTSVKERLTVHLSVQLIDRVKNVVYWTPGMTLAAFAESALENAVDEMERDRGERFPPRNGELKGGRPMK